MEERSEIVLPKVYAGLGRVFLRWAAGLVVRLEVLRLQKADATLETD